MLEADGHGVIGEAATGVAAISQAARLQPDVVLLDIGLPDGSGLDLVAPIRSAVPAAVIVLISSRRASDFGGRLTAAGADGFIDKARLSPSTLRDVFARRAAP